MVLHSEAQSKNNGHDCIAVSVADLSFWCFSCDEYITHPKVEDVFRQVHWGKFGCLPSGELHGAAEGLSMTLVEDRDSGGEKDGKAG